MALHRRLKTLICHVMVGVLLLAQMAVAAYACPSATSSPCAQMGVNANGAMPGDVDLALDDDMPNLCVEHCRFGQQSADAKAQPPQLPPAMAAPLYALPAPGALFPGALSAVPRVHDALATPPHAILHCVLRI